MTAATTATAGSRYGNGLVRRRRCRRSSYQFRFGLIDTLLIRCRIDLDDDFTGFDFLAYGQRCRYEFPR